MRDGDDRGFENVRVRHGEVLDLDRGNPLAAGLDHVLHPVGQLHVTVRIDRADIAGSEPSVLVNDLAALALEIAGNHPVAAHLSSPTETPSCGRSRPSPPTILSSTP